MLTYRTFHCLNYSQLAIHSLYAFRTNPKQSRLTEFQYKESYRRILEKEKYWEDDHYLFYLDRDNRIRKVPKEYQKRKGVYRLKFFEPFYRWWIRLSPDAQFAIIPICKHFSLELVLSIISGSIIYNGANFIIEREDAISEKARVDPNFTEENLKKWKSEKKHGNIEQ